VKNTTARRVDFVVSQRVQCVQLVVKTKTNGTEMRLHESVTLNLK